MRPALETHRHEADAQPASAGLRAGSWPRLRRFAIDAGITALFNTGIAAIVTYVLRLHASFADNLAISMCIGMLMVSLVDGGRLLLWGNGKPPLLPFLGLFAVSLPLSLYIGTALTGAVIGIRFEHIAAFRAGNELGFYILFLFSCVAITWFFWTRARLEMLKADAAAEKARAVAIEKQALQAQLQVLQAQIEPHMLFNTLANLKGLIALDPIRAQQMLDQLIHYLRATLSAARAKRTTLGQEFALLEAYLGLMQVRMGARLSYTVELPSELRNAPIAPMLLQPLVENAIKHGLEPKLDGGQVRVSAERRGDRLQLRVEDTGLGLEAVPDPLAPRLPGSGVGLSNVRERLAALYGASASLTLCTATGGGTCALLDLPA